MDLSNVCISTRTLREFHMKIAFPHERYEQIERREDSILNNLYIKSTFRDKNLLLQDKQREILACVYISTR